MDRFVRRACLSPIFFVILAGCGSRSTETPVVETDSDLMEELLGTSVDPADEPAAEAVDPAEGFGEGMTVDTVSSTSDKTSSKRASRRPAPQGDRLELRLKEGDRFPLIKTIEQTLDQRSEIAPARALTKLQLTMVINVEQVRSDAILMAVRYSQVVYSHDVNGQQVMFDSKTHRGSVPWDAIPYAGMVGNGFSFWLGRDNSIRELVGYREFLERCVAGVPLERRETLLAEISNRFGDDGVANFVDDSIGLLPYDSTVDPDSATRVMKGDTWIRERRLMQPVPVYMTSTYRLNSIDSKSAEIDITGKIASGDAVAPDGVGRIRITGGHSLGHCSVDRATGLPLDMSLTRQITMKITTTDQQEVVQTKIIETTIRSFPEMRGSVAEQRPRTAVRKASGSGADDGAVIPIPASVPAGQAVRAVYPD